MNTIPVVMSSFENIISHDKQLQYASQAVKHYHTEKVPGFFEKDSHNRRPTPSSTTPQGSTSTPPAARNVNSNPPPQSQLNSGNNRRHIVNVDDISKINYEMIKNTPGNLDFKSNSSDVEISGLKTKLYKSRLYDLNDNFLEIISQRMQTKQKEKPSKTQPILLSLQDQIQLLSHVQCNLIKDYQCLLNTERKWFVLKEVMLDANAELDLFSKQEKCRKTVKLGATTVPTNANSNSLVFNRSKRRKTESNIPNNIL